MRWMDLALTRWQLCHSNQDASLNDSGGGGAATLQSPHERHEYLQNFNQASACSSEESLQPVSRLWSTLQPLGRDMKARSLAVPIATVYKETKNPITTSAATSPLPPSKRVTGVWHLPHGHSDNIISCHGRLSFTCSWQTSFVEDRQKERVLVKKKERKKQHRKNEKPCSCQHFFLFFFEVEMMFFFFWWIRVREGLKVIKKS